MKHDVVQYEEAYIKLYIEVNVVRQMCSASAGLIKCEIYVIIQDNSLRRGAI